LAKPAREVARTLVDAIAGGVLTHTFVTHTATDLSDEEMEVTPYTPIPDHIWSHARLFGHSPCGLLFLGGLILPRNTPIGKALRSMCGLFSTGFLESRPVLAAGLARDFYATVVVFAMTVWLALSTHA
jgi:hypothetical protein